MKLRASVVLTGLALQLLWPQAVSACIAVVDEQGRRLTPVIDAESFFVGTLAAVRSADARDIEQLRSRHDFSPARRAVPDSELIRRLSDSARIAEFDIGPGDGSPATTVALWFEDNGVCSGPFNEGLPLEIGQRAVVFSKAVDGWATGWIPNSVSVEKLGQPQLAEVMEQLFRQFDPCPQGAQEERYSLAVMFLRAPKSGFGRGCLVEAQ